MKIPSVIAMFILVLSGCGTTSREPITYAGHVSVRSVQPVHVRVAGSFAAIDGSVSPNERTDAEFRQLIAGSLQNETVDYGITGPRGAVKSRRTGIERILVKW